MGHPIVFYDGGCGLCSRTVRVLMARDRGRAFRFAPLGGETCAAMPEVARHDDGSTIVVWTGATGAGDAGRCLVRSDAVVFVLRRLGGVSGVIGAVLGLCPRVIRDGVYRLVAAHRLRFFGTASACGLPSEGEASVLLP